MQTDLLPIDGTERGQAWGRVFEGWLAATRRKSGRDNTIKTYIIAVRQFFEWLIEAYGEDTAPWDVTSMMAEQWTIQLDRERDLAASTINLKLAAMTSLYDFARKKAVWPADRVNPFRTVERTKVDEYARAVYPTVDELKAILAEINRKTLTGKRDFALLYGFALTCRRSAEWLELRWGDIRHDGPNGQDRVYTYRPRKKGADQVDKAVLDWHAYEAILDYLEAAGRLDPKNGLRPADGDHVWAPLWPERALRFGNGVDVEEVAATPISNKTANGILRKYARRAHVDESKAHLHGLRHAGARLRVEQMKEREGGVDYLEVMRLLNHSSIAITQIYVDKVCEDPEDPGGRDAALALLPGEEDGRDG